MNSTSYTPLEGESLRTFGINEVPSFQGSTASFFATTSFLYTLCFVAIIGASFYRFLTAGILRMQASDSSIRQSNEMIKKTTLGLLGVFSLFLILVTFNKDLVTGDIGLGAFQAKGVPAAATPVTQPPTQPATNSNYAARVASHNSIVAQLSPSNIHTNHKDIPCTEAELSPGGKPSCTSLAFLPIESINTILKVNGDCHCSPLIITGGTEPGHSSHGENKRPFDLKFNTLPKENDLLYIFIKGRGSPTTVGFCYYAFIFNGFTFCDERSPTNPPATWAPHFHVF